MIVPMKKISVLTLGNKKEETLKKLRKLGTVQIEISEGSGEKLGKLREQIALLENAVFTVGKCKDKEQKDVTYSEALTVAGKIAALSERKNLYLSERGALNAELERIKGWGEIDPKIINDLISDGIKIELYEIPKKEYKSIPDGIKTVRLSSDKSSVKFLMLNNEEDASFLEGYKLILPKISADEMRDKVSVLNESILKTDEEISSYSVYAASMQKAVMELQSEVEFETYATGMESEDISCDGTLTVAYFKGYIEAENLDKLKKAAGENSWGIIAEDPTEDDDVPTKLKNNKFVSLIYPLTDFFGTVPGYFEYDISGWFLSFILIFFGIIFGDGGYGLLISAVAAVPVIRSLVKKKPVEPAFLLIGLLGVSTMIWGLLTCTWFGLSTEQLPHWLKALSVPIISNVYADKIWSLPWTPDGVGLTTAQNLQILCFTLALIQLTAAHIKSAVRNKGSLRILSDIGMVLQLVGMYYMVLNLVVNAEVFGFGLNLAGVPVGTVAIVLIGIGFVMGFVFANYEGSILKSIISSLTNIVSVLLGVVNVFSDIVSYIRLWAVGLAGAAISTTVNELVSPFLGNFMLIIFAIILLVFGHGLNMVLNILSVVVHGIRLNTLEFSSHLGMSWSGHKFKPFKE